VSARLMALSSFALSFAGIGSAFVSLASSLKVCFAACSVFFTDCCAFWATFSGGLGAALGALGAFAGAFPANADSGSAIPIAVTVATMRLATVGFLWIIADLLEGKGKHTPSVHRRRWGRRRFQIAIQTLDVG